MSTPFDQAMAEFKAAVTVLIVSDANQHPELAKRTTEAKRKVWNAFKDEMFIASGCVNVGWYYDGSAVILISTATANGYDVRIVAFAEKHSAKLDTRDDGVNSTFVLTFE